LELGLVIFQANECAAILGQLNSANSAKLGVMMEKRGPIEAGRVPFAGIPDKWKAWMGLVWR